LRLQTTSFTPVWEGLAVEAYFTWLDGFPATGHSYLHTLMEEASVWTLKEVSGCSSKRT